VARYARIAPAEVDPHAVFASFGLGSTAAVQLSGELSDRLGREVSPTLAWEHPTIAQASAHLASFPAG
jgi:acyl carrier protein